jgi:hypothetical protein
MPKGAWNVVMCREGKQQEAEGFMAPVAGQACQRAF